MKLMANFRKWDSMQAYDIINLTRSYYQNFAAQIFKKFVRNCEDEGAAEIYKKLHILSMQKHILEDQEYFLNILTKDQINEMKMNMIQICKELRPNAFALAEVLPLPNLACGVLGNEDLDVYNRVVTAVQTREENMERPDWWKMIY